MYVYVKNKVEKQPNSFDISEKIISKRHIKIRFHNTFHNELKNIIIFYFWVFDLREL